MSSKQTRKSISVSGDAYWALKARCEKDGTSMSGVCERLIREFLEMAPRDQAPIVTQVPKRPSAKDIVAVPRKPPVRPYTPAKDIETVLAEVVGPPVVVAPAPIPIKVDRSEQIAAAAARIDARRDEPVKKPGVPLDDMASKIFTF